MLREFQRNCRRKKFADEFPEALPNQLLKSITEGILQGRSKFQKINRLETVQKKNSKSNAEAKTMLEMFPT